MVVWRLSIGATELWAKLDIFILLESRFYLKFQLTNYDYIQSWVFDRHFLKNDYISL